jgi:hypothetical protein
VRIIVLEINATNYEISGHNAKLLAVLLEALVFAYIKEINYSFMNLIILPERKMLTQQIEIQKIKTKIQTIVLLTSYTAWHTGQCVRFFGFIPELLLQSEVNFSK